MNFAYLIAAHKNPKQLERLVRNLLAENVSVFVHVDEKASEAPFVELLTSCKNVFFCKRRIPVNWGGFSQVEATVSLMETMIKHIGIPDYVHLLSGQDFPLKNPAQIARFFNLHHRRNFMEYKQLPKTDWHLGGMNRIEYEWFIDTLGYERAKELTKHQKPKSFISGIIPYGGSSWWSLTGDCVAWLFSQCRDGNKIYDYYKYTLCSDEMFFQTVLLNSHFKETVVNTNLRKIDWSIPEMQPRIWSYGELELLKTTPKLFARKFDENRDSRILDELELFVSQPPVKKDTPAVSVVMSMYNSEKYLKESMDSVLTQTFTDFEFIIVDDGSDDASVQTVESYRDSRIQLIKNKHDFIDSLNKGMSAATGTFIARMDSDDIMLPERLEKQVDFMVSNPHIDVCGAWATGFGRNNNVMRIPVEHKQIVSGLIFANTIINPASFIRKESILRNAIVYKNYPHAEDYKFWTDCVMAGLKFAVIPEILLKYRTSEGQVTVKYADEMMKTSHFIRVEYAEFIINSITNEVDIYTKLLDNLVELVNNETIDFSLLSRVLYEINSNSSWS